MIVSVGHGVNLLVIDAHAHIGGPPLDAEPANFVRLLKRSGINKAIVCRYIPRRPTLVGNQLIHSAIRKYPNNLVGFVWINPNDEGAQQEIRTCVEGWGFRGIKLHLEMEPTSVDRLGKVFKEAEKFHIPLYVHVGDNFELINRLCEKYAVNIIIGHLGTGVYELNPKRLKKALRLSRKHDNVYLETSGNTYFFIKYSLRELGPLKIIFGSDFPHEHPLVLVRAIETLDLTNRDKTQILEGNIRKLVKF